MNGLLGGLLNQNRMQPTVGRYNVPYKSHLGFEDGDTAYNTEAKVYTLVNGILVAGVWTKIWQMTIPAQMAYRWGFGSPAYPHNQGYMYFGVSTKATAFTEGYIRLIQNTSRENRPIPVLESPSSRLHTTDYSTSQKMTPTNINELMALPEKIEYPKVGEDSLLQIWFKVTTAIATNDAAAMSIPVTVYQ